MGDARILPNQSYRKFGSEIHWHESSSLGWASEWTYRTHCKLSQGVSISFPPGSTPISRSSSPAFGVAHSPITASSTALKLTEAHQSTPSSPEPSRYPPVAGSHLQSRKCRRLWSLRRCEVCRLSCRRVIVPLSYVFIFLLLSLLNCFAYNIYGFFLFSLFFLTPLFLSCHFIHFFHFSSFFWRENCVDYI